MPHASDMGDHQPVIRAITEVEILSRELSQVHNYLTKVKTGVEDEETDMCLLKGHEEGLKTIAANLQLQAIKQDLLLTNDYKSLAGKAAGLEKLHLSYK